VHASEHNYLGGGVRITVQAGPGKNVALSEKIPKTKKQ
jgi:hypothetical protein